MADEYKELVLMHFRVLAATFMALGKLWVKPRLHETAWKKSVADGLGTLKATAKAARALKPPRTLRHFHKRYLETMKHNENIVEKYLKGDDRETMKEINLVKDNVLALLKELQGGR
jgi:hypothetical protein